MIKITISGPLKTGKSTIADLIAGVLELHSIDHDVHDDAPPDRDNADRIIETIRRKSEDQPVLIEVVATNRSATHND